MKAWFRIYIGKGRYIAVFKNSIVIEYYDKDDNMYGMDCII